MAKTAAEVFCDRFVKHVTSETVSELVPEQHRLTKTQLEQIKPNDLWMFGVLLYQHPGIGDGILEKDIDKLRDAAKSFDEQHVGRLVTEEGEQYSPLPLPTAATLAAASEEQRTAFWDSLGWLYIFLHKTLMKMKEMRGHDQ